eukprot:scaffold2386_cov67-Cylindrotheca_fusiformis.AAC.1
MDHQHPILFDEVAKAAIPIIDTFDSQGLANLVSAIARVRQDSENCRAVYSVVAESIKNNPHCLNEASETGLVAIAYAFLKGGQVDEELLEMIGMEIKQRENGIDLDAQGWGNLAAAFSNHNSAVAPKVFELLFLNYFEKVDRRSDRLLESIADVFGAVVGGKHFENVPSNFLTKLTKLAIEYSGQARMEDVRDILFSSTRVGIRGDPLQRDLYAAYKP